MKMFTACLPLASLRLPEQWLGDNHPQFSSSFPSRSDISLPSFSPMFYRRMKGSTLIFSSSSSSPELSEWIERLPEKKKPMYAHSLPCIEAWLRQLGFRQKNEDLSAWIVRKPQWHAHLSLDVTDLCIRYLKSGPGNLEKDVERRFSYALSREDIENAILGGP